MKLVTWNVNSVKTRLARTKGLLLRHRPDVLALQELKVSDELFPSPEFQELGYRVAVHGQAGRNGVALLSRGSMEDVAESFVGDPIPDQARVVAATIDGIRVVNLYVVNGRAVGTSDYALKLRWLDAFGAWIRAEHDPARPQHSAWTLVRDAWSAMASTCTSPRPSGTSSRFLCGTRAS